MPGTIVVGVDGSDASAHALRWSLGVAANLHSRVHVIHAWSYPYVGDLQAVAAYGLPRIEFEGAARHVVAVARAKAGPAPAGVQVTETVAMGPAAETLIEAATDADMLVVGRRGSGEFPGLRLGSVSQRCAEFAPCPVTIVPLNASQ